MWISYTLHNIHIHIQFIYYCLVLASERGLSEFSMHTNMFNIATCKHTKCLKYKMNKMQWTVMVYGILEYYSCTILQISL